MRVHGRGLGEQQLYVPAHRAVVCARVPLREGEKIFQLHGAPAADGATDATHVQCEHLCWRVDATAQHPCMGTLLEAKPSAAACNVRWHATRSTPPRVWLVATRAIRRGAALRVASRTAMRSQRKRNTDEDAMLLRALDDEIQRATLQRERRALRALQPVPMYEPAMCIWLETAAVVVAP